MTSSTTCMLGSQCLGFPRGGQSRLRRARGARSMRCWSPTIDASGASIVYCVCTAGILTVNDQYHEFFWVIFCSMYLVYKIIGVTGKSAEGYRISGYSRDRTSSPGVMSLDFPENSEYDNIKYEFEECIEKGWIDLIVLREWYPHPREKTKRTLIVKVWDVDDKGNLIPRKKSVLESSKSWNTEQVHYDTTLHTSEEPLPPKTSTYRIAEDASEVK